MHSEPFVPNLSRLTPNENFFPSTTFNVIKMMTLAVFFQRAACYTLSNKFFRKSKKNLSTSFPSNCKLLTVV